MFLKLFMVYCQKKSCISEKLNCLRRWHCRNISFSSVLMCSSSNSSLSPRNLYQHLQQVQNTQQTNLKSQKFLEKLNDGPQFHDFLRKGDVELHQGHCSLSPDADDIPYINKTYDETKKLRVYFETHGCQMNVNDTEIAWSVLKKKGFLKAQNMKESDVVLLVTCAIREGAEQKIWKRIEMLKQLKRSRIKRNRTPLKIGILGCMAERLKEKILEKEKMVDLVCGPDAYRDLPRMLQATHTGQTAVNVILSLEETYADVIPVRLAANSKTAFVSIMRGCDNMCTYCIVPFTRGRERSRPVSSITEEIRVLSNQGIKEVTLLGQNVNSYRDATEVKHYPGSTKLSKGFSTVYKAKHGGLRFSDLLERVADIDPEMRIRFTSPHPKDFPDEVLYLIRERDNICNSLHLPAQSGSTAVLEAMRRGYTREAYIDLVNHVRSIIPAVALTSDFIAGFCGETEQNHKDTLSLINLITYNFVYCYPYSMRQKTKAYHRLKDDVSDAVKVRRHQELSQAFRQVTLRINQAQIGELQLVLVEGDSPRSSSDLAGRNDGNVKVILPRTRIPETHGSSFTRDILPGDYVAVKINDCSSQVLKGVPICHSRLQDFSNMKAEYMYAAAAS